MDINLNNILIAKIENTKVTDIILPTGITLSKEIIDKIISEYNKYGFIRMNNNINLNTKDTGDIINSLSDNSLNNTDIGERDKLLLKIMKNIIKILYNSGLLLRLDNKEIIIPKIYFSEDKLKFIEFLEGILEKSFIYDIVKNVLKSSFDYNNIENDIYKHDTLLSKLFNVLLLTYFNIEIYDFLNTRKKLNEKTMLNIINYFSANLCIFNNGYVNLPPTICEITNLNENYCFKHIDPYKQRLLKINSEFEINKTILSETSEKLKKYNKKNKILEETNKRIPILEEDNKKYKKDYDFLKQSFDTLSRNNQIVEQEFNNTRNILGNNNNENINIRNNYESILQENRGYVDTINQLKNNLNNISVSYSKQEELNKNLSNDSKICKEERERLYNESVTLLNKLVLEEKDNKKLNLDFSSVNSDLNKYKLEYTKQEEEISSCKILRSVYEEQKSNFITSEDKILRNYNSLKNINDANQTSLVIYQEMEKKSTSTIKKLTEQIEKINKDLLKSDTDKTEALRQLNETSVKLNILIGKNKQESDIIKKLKGDIILAEDDCTKSTKDLTKMYDELKTTSGNFFSLNLNLWSAISVICIIVIIILKK